ncbi:MAG: aspartate aminotransferase family protein [Myxococcota bacterium]
MTTLFPDQSTDDLLARARAHHTPNYRQLPLFLVRGEGVWVWDRDGRRYLDMIAGIAVCSLGHAHPRLVDAVRDQADKIVHCSNLYYNEPALALMDELTRLSFADRVFFTNSGTESNEAALKIARRYWSQVRERPDRSDFLAFRESFHGRSFASLSATGQPKYHEGFEPLLPGFHFADFGDIASVEEALDQAGDRVGAILVEPIQCEGGLRVPPEGFLRKLRKLCDERDVLLMLDEVQTGIGRTAEWFCYEIEGIRPDVMTLAKGLGGGVPVGAMVCTDEVGQGFQPGSHASTFGGNPLATRAGLEVLRTIEQEQLLDHVYEAGEHLGRGLQGLVEKYPDKCVETRGFGLLRGLELKVDDAELPGRVVAKAREEGLLINAVAGRVLRFAPPLVVQRGHLDAALEILDGALAAS